MIRRSVLVSAAMAAMSGCSDDTTAPISNTSQFTSAKALWSATRPVRYSFVASRSCECLPGAVGPVRIEPCLGTADMGANPFDQAPEPP